MSVCWGHGLRWEGDANETVPAPQRAMHIFVQPAALPLSMVPLFSGSSASISDRHVRCNQALGDSERSAIPTYNAGLVSELRCIPSGASTRRGRFGALATREREVHSVRQLGMERVAMRVRAVPRAQ